MSEGPAFSWAEPALSAAQKRVSCQRNYEGLSSHRRLSPCIAVLAGGGQGTRLLSSLQNLLGRVCSFRSGCLDKTDSDQDNQVKCVWSISKSWLHSSHPLEEQCLCVGVVDAHTQCGGAYLLGKDYLADMEKMPPISVPGSWEQPLYFLWGSCLGQSVSVEPLPAVHTGLLSTTGSDILGYWVPDCWPGEKGRRHKQQSCRCPRAQSSGSCAIQQPRYVPSHSAREALESLTLWYATEPLKWLQWLPLAAQLVVRPHCPGEAMGYERMSHRSIRGSSGLFFEMVQQCCIAGKRRDESAPEPNRALSCNKDCVLPPESSASAHEHCFCHYSLQQLRSKKRESGPPFKTFIALISPKYSPSEEQLSGGSSNGRDNVIPPRLHASQVHCWGVPTLWNGFIVYLMKPAQSKKVDQMSSHQFCHLGRVLTSQSSLVSLSSNAPLKERESLQPSTAPVGSDAVRSGVRRSHMGTRPPTTISPSLQGARMTSEDPVGRVGWVNPEHTWSPTLDGQLMPSLCCLPVRTCLARMCSRGWTINMYKVPSHDGTDPGKRPEKQPEAKLGAQGKWEKQGDNSHPPVLKHVISLQEVSHRFPCPLPSAGTLVGDKCYCHVTFCCLRITLGRYYADCHKDGQYPSMAYSPSSVPAGKGIRKAEDQGSSKNTWDLAEGIGLLQKSQVIPAFTKSSSCLRVLTQCPSKTWSASYVMPRSDGVPTESPQPEKEECQRQPVNGSSHKRSCHSHICALISTPALVAGRQAGGPEMYLSYFCWLTHQRSLSLYMHTRLASTEAHDDQDKGSAPKRAQAAQGPQKDQVREEEVVELQGGREVGESPPPGNSDLSLQQRSSTTAFLNACNTHQAGFSVCPVAALTKIQKETRPSRQRNLSVLSESFSSVHPFTKTSSDTKLVSNVQLQGNPESDKEKRQYFLYLNATTRTPTVKSAPRSYSRMPTTLPPTDSTALQAQHYTNKLPAWLPSSLSSLSIIYNQKNTLKKNLTSVIEANACIHWFWNPPQKQHNGRTMGELARHHLRQVHECRDAHLRPRFKKTPCLPVPLSPPQLPRYATRAVYSSLVFKKQKRNLLQLVPNKADCKLCRAWATQRSIEKGTLEFSNNAFLRKMYLPTSSTPFEQHAVMGKEEEKEEEEKEEEEEEEEKEEENWCVSSYSCVALVYTLGLSHWYRMMGWLEAKASSYHIWSFPWAFFHQMEGMVCLETEVEKDAKLSMEASEGPPSTLAACSLGSFTNISHTWLGCRHLPDSNSHIILWLEGPNWINWDAKLWEIMDTSAMANVHDRADKRDTALLSLQIQAKDINNCDHTMYGWEGNGASTGCSLNKGRSRPLLAGLKVLDTRAAGTLQGLKTSSTEHQQQTKISKIKSAPGPLPPSSEQWNKNVSGEHQPGQQSLHNLLSGHMVRLRTQSSELVATVSISSENQHCKTTGPSQSLYLPKAHLLSHSIKPVLSLKLPKTQGPRAHSTALHAVNVFIYFGSREIITSNAVLSPRDPNAALDGNATVAMSLNWTKSAGTSQVTDPYNPESGWWLYFPPNRTLKIYTSYYMTQFDKKRNGNVEPQNTENYLPQSEPQALSSMRQKQYGSKGSRYNSAGLVIASQISKQVPQASFHTEDTDKSDLPSAFKEENRNPLESWTADHMDLWESEQELVLCMEKPSSMEMEVPTLKALLGQSWHSLAKAAEVLVLYEFAGPVRYTSVSISETCSLPISVPAPEATDLLSMRTAHNSPRPPFLDALSQSLQPHWLCLSAACNVVDPKSPRPLVCSLKEAGKLLFFSSTSGLRLQRSPGKCRQRQLHSEDTCAHPVIKNSATVLSTYDSPRACPEPSGLGCSVPYVPSCKHHLPQYLAASAFLTLLLATCTESFGTCFNLSPFSAVEQNRRIKAGSEPKHGKTDTGMHGVSFGLTLGRLKVNDMDTDLSHLPFWARGRRRVKQVNKSARSGFKCLQPPAQATAGSLQQLRMNASIFPLDTTKRPNPRRRIGERCSDTVTWDEQPKERTKHL
ncbi:hypothetical protein U0070_014791 [Myodes glareolus]|uniref:Uncharacterized protein n=1 Tax=Myodes glareolus TaxID=447135 RepID=A0AAW0H661_MYOGA